MLGSAPRVALVARQGPEDPPGQCRCNRWVVSCWSLGDAPRWQRGAVARRRRARGALIHMIGVLAPFIAIVFVAVTASIQSEYANYPIGRGRKCAASATYWVAVASSWEARGFEDARTPGRSYRGEELRWVVPRDGTRVVRPTGAPPRRARVVVSPDFDFVTLRRRAGQPWPRTGKPRVGRDGCFLNSAPFTAIYCHD